MPPYNMDLFIVNRYYGDDKKEGKDSDEKVKLAVLLSKIEERKKQKEAIQKAKLNYESPDLKSHIGEHVDDIATSVTTFEGEDDDKNKKRHKNIDLIDDKRTGEKEARDIVEKGDSTEKKKKKKKHKRKWRETCDSEESEGDAGETKIVKSVEKVEGFTVLGTDKFKKKQKVKRVLPQWLANPSIVSVNLQQLTTTVKDIPGLDRDIVHALKRNNITHFFPGNFLIVH